MDALPRAPTILDIESAVFSHDVIDRRTTIVVRVGFRLGEIIDLESGLATGVALKQVLHDPAVHVAIGVTHPDDVSVCIFGLQRFKLFVHLGQLASVQIIAAFGAVASVDPTSDEFFL